MRFFDISTAINRDTVTWEDDSPPGIHWQQLISRGDAVNLSTLTINTHTATHVDVPYHFVENGKKLHEIDLSLFVGECRVVETAVRTIGATTLENLGIPGTERILFKTGSSRLYREKKFSTNFSALDESGARWLAGRRVKLVGIDYLSIEHHGSPGNAVHLTLLSAGIAILEGLNLEQIHPGKYHLFALPLKLEGTEGAPVRAILIDP